MIRFPFRSLLLSLVLVAVAGAGCSKEENSPPKASGGAATSARQDEVKIEVKDPSGTDLLKVELEPDALEVTFGGRVVQARRLDGDKHKFKGDDGKVAFVVKRKSDGFKVQAADGDTLLAKVKKKEGGRLKIAKTAEMEAALEIVPASDTRAKVKRGDVVLGRVVFVPDDGRIKVQGQDGGTRFKAHGKKALFGLGVLLDDQLSPDARNIVAAELIHEALR